MAVTLQALLSFIGFKPVFSYGLAIAILVTCLYVYGFWAGKNWARRVVIFISVASLLLLFPEIAKHQTSREIRGIANSPIAIFLLYWLNTRVAKNYFGADLAPIQPTI